MSTYSEGERVRYSGKGLYQSFTHLIGKVGTVIETREDGRTELARVEFDNATPLHGNTFEVYTDNLEAVSTPDVVRKPSHYTSHPSGIECIDIVKHMSFTLGNVIKYVWRADLKGNALEDLEKAQQYLAFELDRRKAAANA